MSNPLSDRVIRDSRPIKYIIGENLRQQLSLCQAAGVVFNNSAAEISGYTDAASTCAAFKGAGLSANGQTRVDRGLNRANKVAEGAPGQV